MFHVCLEKLTKVPFKNVHQLKGFHKKIRNNSIKEHAFSISLLGDRGAGEMVLPRAGKVVNGFR